VTDPGEDLAHLRDKARALASARLCGPGLWRALLSLLLGVRVLVMRKELQQRFRKEWLHELAETSGEQY